MGREKFSKGITLIALVITIIILLILAGISIATLTGENGILTQAQNSKIKNIEGEEKEQIGLAFNAAKIKKQIEDDDSSVTSTELEAELNYNGIRNVEVTGEGTLTVEFTDTRNIYTISQNGKIEKVTSGEVVTPPVQEPEVSREGLNVGDYINYEPDTVTTGYSSTKLSEAITGSASNTADITQDTLNWQILKIYDDGSMDVIGSPTRQTIYFKDAEGYNNGVYVMDDICKTLYSRGEIKARSVDLEDFEKNLTDAGKTAKATYISNQVSALATGDYITNVNTENNTVTYEKGHSYYPNIYTEENGSGIDTSTVKTNGIKDIDTLKDAEGNPTYDTSRGTSAYKQATANLTVTYTYYNISINNANYGGAWKALSSSNSFWLASRFVSCISSRATFGLRYASRTNIDGSGMYYSSISTSAERYNRLRPVVHLGSEVQIEACTGTNSKTNTHTITQY